MRGLRRGQTYNSSVDRLLLVLPSATYRAQDFLSAARDLGVAVTVASERRAAMSAAMGERALTVSLSDPARAAEQIAERARETPFAAIVGVDDQGVMAAALGAERLGLAHNPPAAVARTRDKAAMRRALAEARVRQPRFALLPAGVDAAAVAGQVGLPCVIKPLGLSGSRGVIRADDGEQARAAEERIRAILAAAGEPADASLLLESYLPGEEVAVEGLLRGGRLEVLAVFDKPDPLEGPYFEETLYVTPSRLPAAVLGEVEAVTARAADALGLREGPVHAELRVDGEQVSVLELAARSIGGLCSRALRFGAGVSLEQVILRHALGLGLDDIGARVDGIGRDDDPDSPRRRAGRGRGAGGRAGGGGHRGAGDHDRARAARGAAARRRPIPRVSVRPRGERRCGGVLAARRARPPADRDRAASARAR